MIASHVDISKALQIGGWMSEKELTWLAKTVENCKTIVEFGCYHGRSTRALADNSPPDAKVWAVDPWNGDYKTEEGHLVKAVDSYCLPYFKRNLQDHIDSGKVIVSRGFSYNFESSYAMDFIFIDGDHRYGTVVKDIKKALELVSNNGIIAGHDYGHPDWTGVKKAVDEFFDHVEIEDTIWSVRF
jgi:predicted O-methyltransferase YrrM